MVSNYSHGRVCRQSSKEKSPFTGGKEPEDFITLCKSNNPTGSRSQVQSFLPCILPNEECTPSLPTQRRKLSFTRKVSLAEASLEGPIGAGLLTGKCSWAGLWKKKKVSESNKDFKNLRFLLELSEGKRNLAFCSAHPHASKSARLLNRPFDRRFGLDETFRIALKVPSQTLPSSKETYSVRGLDKSIFSLASSVQGQTLKYI